MNKYFPSPSKALKMNLTRVAHTVSRHRKKQTHPKPDKLYSFLLQLISLKALSDLRINCHGNK